MSAILVYHSVDDYVTAPFLQNTPATIAKHARWLINLKTQPDSLSSILTNPDQQRVAVTFDDGYDDFFEALPVLQRLNIRPTLFICPDKVGSINDWSGGTLRGRRLLSADQLLELLKEGVDIQCHGWTHCDLTTLPQQQLHTHFQWATRWFESNLGYYPSVLAYPFGKYNALVANVAKSYFKFALAVDRDWKAPATLSIPRITAVEPMTLPWLTSQIRSKSLPNYVGNRDMKCGPHSILFNTDYSAITMEK
jgi:peptidoglycan/xylan/chitin deacetylase (PgdA/CDA1 family)